MHLHQHLEYRAGIDPELEWAVAGDERLSYGEAAERVARLAGALVEAGVERGDRVAILARNCLEYSLFYFAASKAGAVPVPLNFRLAPPEWRYILEHSGARVLLAQPAFAEAIDGFRRELPRLRHCVSIGEFHGWTPLARWLQAEPLSAAASRERSWNEVSQIYTSGTTGRPKGVVMSQRALLAVVMQYRIAYDFRRGDRMLIVMPMYHMGGVFWSGFVSSCGGSMRVMTDFDPHETVRALDEGRVSFTFLVPSMIQACLTRVHDVGTRRYADLRMIGYGASPIAEATLRHALDVFRCEFVQAYGMTEAPNLTYLTHADHERALAGRSDLLLSAGRAGPGSALKIVDEHDCELGVGEVGEICGYGPQLMDGYWQLADETAAALREGWIRTGDAGCLDSEGYLYLKDRTKDMIVSGGENVYPREVEDALFTHPAVVDAAVIGVPSTRWGEEVKAIVVLAPGAALRADELIDWCKARIASYKCPRSIDFVDELPRNASGKVLKRELREPFWSGTERRVS